MDELIALGASLRQAREARDLNLEELEKLTRIRLKFLEAMEQGAFGEIDNPLQLKGFLRSYARAVELDPDAVLAHYERAYQASQGKRGRRKKQEKNPTDVPSLDLSAPPAGYTTTPRQVTQELPRYGSDKITQRPAWFRWLRLSFLTLVAIGLAIGAVVGGIFGINELTSGDSATAPPPVVTFGTQASGDGDTSVGNPPALSPTATGVVIAPPGNDVVVDGSAFVISFQAESRLWLDVIIDGNQIFRGILAPGTGFQETVTESITIKTTNAGGLLLSINNEEFKLGEGRVEAEQTFTRDGLIIPTQPPPATPTAFASPTATWTMVLSLTATQDINLLEASPSPTLFFTPGSPTLTPFPTPSNSTPTPLPPLPSPSPIFSPTFSPTPTFLFTLTPSVTPSLTLTPTIPATATPFLPPRETRTPTPDK